MYSKCIILASFIVTLNGVLSVPPETINGKPEPLTQEQKKLIHEAILEPLNNIGNVGRIIYALMTSDAAFGKFLADASAIINKAVGFENYQKSVNTIIQYTQKPGFSKKLSALFKEVSDLKDNITGDTLQTAVQVLSNITKSYTASEELVEKIKGEGMNPQTQKVVFAF